MVWVYIVCLHHLHSSWPLTFFFTLLKLHLCEESYSTQLKSFSCNAVINRLDLYHLKGSSHNFSKMACGHNCHFHMSSYFPFNFHCLLFGGCGEQRYPWRITVKKYCVILWSWNTWSTATLQTATQRCSGSFFSSCLPFLSGGRRKKISFHYRDH